MTIALAPLIVTIQNYVDAAFVEENAELLARVAEMEAAIASYEADAEAADAQIDGLEADNAVLVAGNEALIAEVHTLNVQISDLQAQVVDLQAQLESATVFPVITGISDMTVNETAPAAVFTVTMDRTSTRAVNIDYTTVNGTAIAGQDYTATSGILVIVPGALSATVSVPILNDTAVESNEAFTLALSNARLSLAMNDATGSGTIVSEDVTEPPPVPGTWPSATNTGYTGTLTLYSGSKNITAANVVIENKRITGGVLRITGNNVTVRNCLLENTNDSWSIDAEGATGLKVLNSTFTGPGRNNSAILTGGNSTVEGCNISGWENGIMVQEGTHRFVRNYIHTLGPSGSAGTAHVDGIQIAGPCTGALIEDNHIEAWDTSCIIIKADWGAIQNVNVNHNRLINTPGRQTAYAVYSYSVGTKLTTGTRITNNVMQRGNGGYIATSNSTPVVSGNTDYITGNPVS